MFRKLFKSVREYKKASILSGVYVAIEVVLDVLMPYFIADLLDAVSGRQMSIIIKVGIMLVVMALLSFVFGVLSGVSCSKASSGFAKNLRKDLYHKIQDFSFKNIDKFSPASLITRITTDVNFVQMSYQMIIRIAIRSPLVLIFTLIMTFTVNAKLAIIFLIACPLLFAGLILIMKLVHPIFVKVIKEYDDLNQVVEENVRGARVVKAYAREDYEVKKFGNISNSIYKDYSRARKLLAYNSPLMQFAVYTCMILVAFIGAKLIVNSNGTALTTGELTIMFTYSMQMLNSLLMFSMVVVNITISRPSCERIIEVLNEQPDIVSPENAIIDVKNGEIVFDNVSFSYTGDFSKLVLKDINLKIKSGQTIGVLGATGSSKSTLVSLIPRLYDTTAGNVFVAGKNVKDYDVKALRDAVSVVLQKNVLFSGTIKENLKWGNAKATDKEIKHACKVACMDDFIKTLPDKYDTHVEQGGSNFSGGQKQRLCIARALLKKPKILILDDSTSAVDTKTDSLIRKALKEEMPDTTKIIIAQRINSLQAADMIIVLDKGKIIAQGKHNTLLKTCDIYKDIYNQQTKKGGKKNESK
ncbi:MAG: ABC transporter ATP-binding protein [Clostridia bacterium]|nr:ABC transporter ATP-binding protein [Clostridia bacterium]